MLHQSLLVQSAALDSAARTLSGSGLRVGLVPYGTYGPLASVLHAETISAVPPPKMEQERRIDPYKRWTDQDHDELVRQTERMRSIDDTLKQVFAQIADIRSESRQAIDALAARLKLVEDRNTRQDGAELATVRAAKDAAHIRAMQVSVGVAIASIILNQLLPVVMKALGAH